MKYEFDCGTLVRDRVTGIEGTVIAQCTFLNGCVQYGIKQKAKDDGSVHPTQYIDEGQVEFVHPKSKEEQLEVEREAPQSTVLLRGGGGPSDTPGQSCDVPTVDYFGGDDVLM